MAKGLAVAGAAALAVGLSACGKSSKDAASKVMIVHQRY